MGGVLIALNPRNGKILSMVSYPGYDTNKFSTGISQKEFNLLLGDEGAPLNNKAIAGLYAPGSTFKMVGATAILEEGILSADQELEGPGQISIGSFTFKDWKGGGHGNTNVYKALASSVDTYFYKSIAGLN